MLVGLQAAVSRDTNPLSISNYRVANVRKVSYPTSPPEAKGLELLSSASLISENSSCLLPDRLAKVVSDSSHSSIHENSIITLSETSSNNSRCSSSRLDSDVFTKPKSKSGRVYIEDGIREDDILCGRGGRSNNHPGNKRYRQVVNDMRVMYQNTETKTVKTDLSRAIVEHCCCYGARFLKIDNATGNYFVLTKGEARKKTSQALRETKDLKWTVS